MILVCDLMWTLELWKNFQMSCRACGLAAPNPLTEAFVLPLAVDLTGWPVANTAVNSMCAYESLCLTAVFKTPVKSFWIQLVCSLEPFILSHSHSHHLYGPRINCSCWAVCKSYKQCKHSTNSMKHFHTVNLACSELEAVLRVGSSMIPDQQQLPAAGLPSAARW